MALVSLKPCACNRLAWGRQYSWLDLIGFSLEKNKQKETNEEEKDKGGRRRKKIVKKRRWRGKGGKREGKLGRKRDNNYTQWGFQGSAHSDS